jgi:hypothetical protein
MTNVVAAAHRSSRCRLDGIIANSNWRLRAPPQAADLSAVSAGEH